MKSSNFLLAKVLVICLLAFGGCQAVHAQSTWLNHANQGGLNIIGSTAYTPATPLDIRTIMIMLIRVALGFLAILFLGITILGGFKYLTANGDSKKVSAAIATITQGAIGLLIVVSAFGVTIFVVNALGWASQGYMSY